MSEKIEDIYEALVDAIDSVAPDQEKLFLAKLALTLAHELGDVARLKTAIAVSQKDLEFSAMKEAEAIT